MKPQKFQPEAPLYVLAYDITEDKERRKVDKILQGYGFRVQKSVYECHLNRMSKKRLMQKLNALNLKTGHIRCYGISQHVNIIGSEVDEIDDDFIYFFD